ncbi:hypothetical protein PR048_033376 [Dryococelus australis]|uniref:Uncharacterized protein n=1 Tax=Dryococelus australis TaxID=614101 RepID=A0ABQ9G034_9NEOP|nr:hypothetical protein PR048_033376 [Dryococelus australis]
MKPQILHVSNEQACDVSVGRPSRPRTQKETLKCTPPAVKRAWKRVYRPTNAGRSVLLRKVVSYSAPTETAPRRVSFRPPLPEQTRDRDSHESACATRRRRRARTQLTSLSAGPPCHQTVEWPRTQTIQAGGSGTAMTAAQPRRTPLPGCRCLNRRRNFWLGYSPHNQGEPGSIPGGIAPGFSHAGIVPDNTTGRRGFLGVLLLPPPQHSGAAPCSPRITPISSQDLTGMIAEGILGEDDTWSDLHVYQLMRRDRCNRFYNSSWSFEEVSGVSDHIPTPLDAQRCKNYLRGLSWRGGVVGPHPRQRTLTFTGTPAFPSISRGTTPERRGRVEGKLRSWSRRGKISLDEKHGLCYTRSTAIGCCLLEEAFSWSTGPLRIRQHRHGSYMIRVQTVNTCLKVIQPIKTVRDEPAGLGDDHLGAEVVELVPQVLGLEVTVDEQQLGAVAAHLDAARRRRRARGVPLPIAAVARLRARLRAGRLASRRPSLGLPLAVRALLHVHLHILPFIGFLLLGQVLLLFVAAPTTAPFCKRHTDTNFNLIISPLSASSLSYHHVHTLTFASHHKTSLSTSTSSFHSHSAIAI